jgi:hypothetical protein
VHETEGFTRAGPVDDIALNLLPPELPLGRQRHSYGAGPFAKLRMPALPNEPGVYLWAQDEQILYVGQTRLPLRARLGPQGYSTISNYNTFARQPGRTNGGQQTNCRINALANRVLSDGHVLTIWYRTTQADEARYVEAEWMRNFGIPPWNRRDDRRA